MAPSHSDAFPPFSSFTAVNTFSESHSALECLMMNYSTLTSNRQRPAWHFIVCTIFMTTEFSIKFLSPSLRQLKISFRSLLINLWWSVECTMTIKIDFINKTLPVQMMTKSVSLFNERIYGSGMETSRKLSDFCLSDRAWICEKQETTMIVYHLECCTTAHPSPAIVHIGVRRLSKIFGALGVWSNNFGENAK